jgi:hypothetical protein
MEFPRMLKLQFGRPTASTPRILCLGAHADDIEIGCGGTILTLLDSYPHAEFYWVVFSANKQRAHFGLKLHYYKLNF